MTPETINEITEQLLGLWFNEPPPNLRVAIQRILTECQCARPATPPYITRKPAPRIIDGVEYTHTLLSAPARLMGKVRREQAPCYAVARLESHSYETVHCLPINSPDLVELVEDTIDWAKVPIDTKVLCVRDDGTSLQHHYAGIYNGKPSTFGYGSTSWTSTNRQKPPIWDWDKIKLAPTEHESSTNATA